MLVFPHLKIQPIHRAVSSLYVAVLAAKKSTFHVPIGRRRIYDLTDEELDKLGSPFSSELAKAYLELSSIVYNGGILYAFDSVCLPVRDCLL